MFSAIAFLARISIEIGSVNNLTCSGVSLGGRVFTVNFAEHLDVVHWNCWVSTRLRTASDFEALPKVWRSCDSCGR